MIEAIKAIQEGLAYAKFADPAIKAAIIGILEPLDRELTEENYEQGGDVDAAVAELEEAINASDSEKEVDNGDAVEEDEDDPFSGLGEEDEEETK